MEDQICRNDKILTINNSNIMPYAVQTFYRIKIHDNNNTKAGGSKLDLNRSKVYAFL